jgi:hypothetical protein
VSSLDPAVSNALATPAAPAAEPRRGVIESSRRAWLKYLAGMALALLPFLLLKDDPHWVNIIAFTYLMGGLTAIGTIVSHGDQANRITKAAVM